MSDSAKKTAAPAKAKSGDSLVDIVKTIVTVVVIVLGIRTFAFEPFNIPSGSMIPTLLIGDYVFVSKFSYGYSGYSFPFFHPQFAGRVFGSLPKRGDVAVFKLPRDPSIDYIKRIVGLPGDKLQVIDGVLNINDKPVALARAEETLPNGVQHPLLQPVNNGPLDNTIVYEVPPDHVFGMGDNRDNSLDSRVPPRDNGVGYIPIENLVGRAEFRFFSFDGNTPWWHVWEWPFAIRYSRLFTGVH